MGRHPSRFTQTDVARATKAAIKAGAKAVEIRPNGTIFIRLDDQALAQPDSPPANPWDDEEEAA